MMDIREGLKIYKDQNDMLQQFRTNVVNGHEYYRFTIQNKREKIDISDWYEIENYEYSNFYVGLSQVVDIFNALDLPLARIDIKESQDGLTEETYQYCEYIDLWKILNEREDFDFLVAMVYITQLEFWNDNLKELQNIVKRALKNKGFKIPNFKPSVFVAMSFDKDLEAIRKSISKVINDEGLMPLLIDSKEHNNQIVPEIFSEIDKAKFVIADLTHHKTGVYYEAGYAKGKGKEVIFACQKEDFANRHFDVAQTNTIVWETPDELSERLAKRIEAMTLSV